jgi:hypothetical protein
MIPWELGKWARRLELWPWKNSRDPGVLMAATSGKE